ncbi:MAG: AAA family ATPase [Gudongella sp.]|nr:AAA family ATPase [Gudongella sp.]
MIIKEFSTNQFAGLKNQSFKFDNNLNIVLGPNEAGKSTMVNGIVATLFNRIKLGDKLKEDLEFKERFLPYPNGDNAHGRVVLDFEEEEYILEKEWGSVPSIKLICPDRSTLRDESSIGENLSKLLRYGEGSYKRIIFSRQEDLKEALSLMTSDDSTVYEIGDLLRKSVMELDGVSLDELEKKIDEDIELMFKRWDIDKEYPENNRGVNNPYTKGIGTILASFYEKEKLDKIKRETQLKEKELEDAYESLKKIEEKLEELKIRKKELEIIEPDLRKRSKLEPKFFELEKESKSLKKTYEDWPLLEQSLEEVRKKLLSIDKELKILDEEKELAANSELKKDIENKIEKASMTKETIKAAKEELKEMPEISEEDLSHLEKINLEAEKLQATINAGSISGKLIRLPDGMEIFVDKGNEGSQELSEGEDFFSEGLITIKSNLGLELRLASGKQNIDEITQILEKYLEDINKKLALYGVDSIEETKHLYKRLTKLNNDISTSSAQLEIILGDETLEDLRAKLESLDKVGYIRNIQEIKDDINNKTEELLTRRVEESNIEKGLKVLIEEYTTKDVLFDKIIDSKVELKEITKELSSLKEIPLEFDSIESYFEKLDESRSKFEEYNEDYHKKKDVYLEIENDMPDTSYEELEKDYQYSNEQFERLLSRGKKLLKLRDTFNSVKERMDQDTNKPLLDSMSKYLSILTGGNYKIYNLDDSLNMRLINSKESEIPLNLLSTGTKDSVSLAVRLSLAETLQEEETGLLVLDDCLVDMDPERKKLAIDMIKEFSQKHQVIFTTCNPVTAEELGGNVILL